MYADFKLVKQNIQNVDYSYVGIYGWTRNPLVEFYVVDNWLSQWRPGDWVGNKKHGDFIIDGATYTVYENTRTGPSIDGNATFKQYFSIRQTARDCGTIDITAHFKQWEKLGMNMGKMHEAKVLGEAGSTGSGTSGTADFPYAKVYIGEGNTSYNDPNPNNGNGNGNGNTNNNGWQWPFGDWWNWNNPNTNSNDNPSNVQTNPSVSTGNEDYCSATGHSGQSIKVTSNQVGDINGIGYELWSDSGNNSATFYEDGSFSCSFRNAKDYLCRSGLSFDSTQTHDQIGQIYADFKLVKQNIQNVDYSYVGIYGWSRDPLIEFYVVDNWLSQWRPGDWVGNKKHGDFIIDGATYTVYENTRTGPSIDGDNTFFKQFFSIRQNARECGRIDVTAHFKQWEKLGMKLGKMHEVKILGEAGSTGSGTSGTADFPYAKVFIDKGNDEPIDINDTPSCPSTILDQGYPCCSDSQCVIVYTDESGDWGVENNNWCGCGDRVPEPPTPSSCPSTILDQGYPCCSDNKCVVVYTDESGDWGVEDGNWCGCGGGKIVTTTTTTTTKKTTTKKTTTRTTTKTKTTTKADKTNFCSITSHSGQSVTEYSNKVGSIGGIGYELWSDSGNNSATFYSDGSFSCSFRNAKDYLCRTGLSFDSTKTHEQIGHMYADFKLVKQNIQNVDYSYVGIYGWTRNPLVEFYVVDNWLSQWRPGDWVGNKKHGDFIIDGATYTVYENNS
ncbi:family 11 glycoside hydrolase, partial [Piromyces sp. E2]